MRASDRTPDEVAAVVELCLDELAAQHAHTAAVVANRCEPLRLAAVADALGRFTLQTYVLPDDAAAVRADGGRPAEGRERDSGQR